MNNGEELTRPIIGIENRTAQEVFDIMCDRFRRSSPSAVEAAEVVSDDPTPEMIRAGMDSLVWWIEPYSAPRESGIAIDSDMSEADAAFYNAQQMDAIADLYRAMRAASPPPASPSAPQGVEVPEGWALVPREPTAAMVNAWPRQNYGAGHERAIYAAMIAAAPAIQTSPEAGR